MVGFIATNTIMEMIFNLKNTLYYLRLLNISNSQTEVTKKRFDATFIDQLFYRAKKAPNGTNIYLVFHGIITLRKALLLWR